jgi:hypothetical protein
MNNYEYLAGGMHYNGMLCGGGVSGTAFIAGTGPRKTSIEIHGTGVAGRHQQEFYIVYR